MFNLFGKPAQTVSVPVELLPDAAPSLPAGQIENDGHITSASPDLVALACDGWIIKQKIEALQKELKEITEKLENSLGAGAALAVDGMCRVTLSSRQTVKLTDVDKCEALLGGRFHDLVETHIEYTLTDKLKAMALDPDHPLSEGLRSCLVIKDSTVVTFRPGKAL